MATLTAPPTAAVPPRPSDVAAILTKPITQQQQASITAPPKSSDTTTTTTHTPPPPAPGPKVIPWTTLQPVAIAIVPQNQLKNLLGNFAGDVRDVLATSVSVGLSVALGLSTNRLIGSILDRYLPGNPKNVQHQILRVMALAVIIVLITFLMARVLRPRVSTTEGSPASLLLTAEQQLGIVTRKT